MKSSSLILPQSMLRYLVMAACVALVHTAFSQQVTFSPYVQLGDNGTFGATDQIVIAWQTDETTPNASAYSVAFRADEHGRRSVRPTGRVIDNYLSADPALPTIPGAYGPHTNYTAVLRGLSHDTEYHYVVTGPGMPSGGLASSFHTRKRGSVFSFAVEGDEGYFPFVPNSNPARIVNYEARIAHLVYNAAKIQLANQPPRPAPDFIVDAGDNVYNEGTEDNYRDFFFPVFNNDQDSNETGAPILRSKLFFPVDGNHDLGSTGISANLLADNSAPPFTGTLSGGDALSFFNDFYFPQNGPQGFDIQYAWNDDTAAATGFTMTYQAKAIALRQQSRLFATRRLLTRAREPRVRSTTRATTRSTTAMRIFCFWMLTRTSSTTTFPARTPLMPRLRYLRRIQQPWAMGDQRSRFQRAALEGCRLSPARVFIWRCNDCEQPNARDSKAA